MNTAKLQELKQEWDRLTDLEGEVNTKVDYTDFYQEVEGFIHKTCMEYKIQDYGNVRNYVMTFVTYELNISDLLPNWNNYNLYQMSAIKEMIIGLNIMEDTNIKRFLTGVLEASH